MSTPAAKFALHSADPPPRSGLQPMSRVAEYLAELTGTRDRDLLDLTLVGALRELLQPQQVAIYRTVGEGEDQRWLTRACLGRGDAAARADALWAEVESLPRLEAHRERWASLRRREAYCLPGPPAVAYFPLLNETGAAGVVEVHSALPLRADELRTVGSILRIYRNFHGLLDDSERDSLTGLLNRKTFDDIFLRLSSSAPDVAAPGEGIHSAELRRLAPAGSFWLAVIDIDHFKRVNDVFGHLIGDEVLLLLSRLMRSCFRFHDHLYRFGGEEFVVLMRCGEALAARSALERLRLNVEGYRFPQVQQITVSIGCTELRADDTPSAAFERADKALFHVKQNGRNQVAHHAELVAAGHLSDRTRDSDVELF